MSDNTTSPVLKMRSIPAEVPADKRWKVTIDGVETSVDHLTLRSKFGALEYGMRPEGYPAWVFQQPGGVLTIPWARLPGGTVLVGLIEESRANLGGAQLCAIGGFPEPGESTATAEQRERHEESGLAGVPEKLPGAPLACNRLFWVVLSDTDGDTAYGLRVPYQALGKSGDGSWQIVDETILVKYSKRAKLVFRPWQEMVQRTPDALALAAIARLLAHLHLQPI